MADTVSKVYDQLPPAWAAACRAKQSTTFAWAHDGEKTNGGWVELHSDGQLVTRWGSGTWECDDEDPVICKLIFGSSSHWCQLQGGTGKFLVEKRILRRGGQVAPNPKVKGVEVVSAGWIVEPHGHQDQKKTPPSAEKILQAKLKAAEVAEEKKRAAEKAASEAAEAASAALATAKDMEKLAKKAEAARCRAVDAADQAKKEAEAALAERDGIGLGRFGFVTPQLKRTKETMGDGGSQTKEKCAKQTEATLPQAEATGLNRFGFTTPQAKLAIEASDKERSPSQAKRSKADSEVSSSTSIKEETKDAALETKDAEEAEEDSSPPDAKQSRKTTLDEPKEKRARCVRNPAGVDWWIANVEAASN